MSNIKEKVLQKIYSGETLMERQAVVVFLIMSVSSLIVIVIDILLDVDLKDSFYRLSNIIQAVLILVVFGLFLFNKLTAKTAVIYYAIIIQVGLMADLSHGVVLDTLVSRKFILANMTLCLSVIVALILSYVRYLPFIFAIFSSSAYLVAGFLTSSFSILSMSVILGFIFIATAFLGEIMYRSIRKMQDDNDELHNERESLLSFLHIDKDELRSLIDGMKQKNVAPEQTTHVLKMLGKRSEELIMYRAKEIMSMEEQNFALLMEYCPEITRSEREVCSLILQDKNTREISILLDKSINTITSTRSHIRAKLKLSKDANLYDELVRITKGEQKR